LCTHPAKILYKALQSCPPICKMPRSRVPLYQCGLCPVSSYSNALLNKHHIEKHASIDRTHVCETCSAGFPTKHAIAKHRKLCEGKRASLNTPVQSTWGALTCPLCRRRFKQMRRLLEHRERHELGESSQESTPERR